MTGSAAAVKEPVVGDFSELRVLVVHEWLYAWAGGERCLEQILAIFPRADLLVGIVTPAMRDYNDVCRRARESWVGRLPGARGNHRWFLPLHAAAFALEDTSGYDLIVSSSHAFEKFIRARGGTPHLCYCYSPPRFIWDFQDVYAERASLVARAALTIAAPVLRTFDRAAARRVDSFVSISRHIAARVQRCYGISSEVVYPPVAVKDAALDGTGRSVPAEPYILCLGRLVEYKRIDLLIRSAEQLRMKLVVAGEGPQREALERIAGRWTEFTGPVSEGEAAALLENCAAFVFAGEEDFGIALVEANAYGRPVVCYDRGGAAETMIANETAIMFGRQTESDVTAATRACLSRTWDPAALKTNATRFAPEHFRSGFRRAVAKVLS